jgi:phosphoglycerol transferase MdoB-like AlkP superfamily enzyme
MFVLFDIGPPGGEIGAIAGLAFFLICIAVAFITFRLLKKTFKLALRIVVVFVILAIGLVGTMVWFFIGSSGRGPVRPPQRPPAATRTR